MPLVVKDRVRETSVTAGTGTITLAGAVNGFQSFSVIGNGNTTYYTIVDPLTNEWEVGIGTYTSSGTTLSRDTILESSTGGTAVNFSANSKDVFVTYPAERSVTSDYPNTFTDSQVISVNSTTDALRITQEGTGNALLVEDSANPDSTPVVVTNAGRFVIGYTTNIAGSGGVNSFYQQHGTSNAGASAGFYDWQNVAIAGPIYNFNKSKSGAIGTRGIVSSGDRLGAITFAGDDGTNFISAGQIACLVDGTPGTNDMPGRLTFSTTAGGASTVTERMRIDSAGNVGIATLTPGSALDVKGTLRLSGSSSGYVGLAPAAAAGSTTYTLPSADGTTGQVLSTNGSGTLSWATSASGDVVGPASATDNAVVRFDGTTGKLVQNSSVVVDDSGNVGIGTTTPTSMLQVTNTSGGAASVLAEGQAGVNNTVARSSNDADGPNYNLRKSRGTIASKTAITTNDVLGNFLFQGYDGTNNLNLASITAVVSDYTSSTNITTAFSFQLTNAGTARAERMRITGAGDVGIGVTAPAAKLEAYGTIQARPAATQDAVAIAGRAGGTGSFVATITPTTLSASRTVTLPNADINFTTGLGVANGGTGTTSLTANNVILGNGTSAVQFVAPGTSGNVLTSNGTTWTSAAPAVTLAGNNAFTGANTFYNATGQTFGTATSTQDGIIIAGSATGSATRRITVQPAANLSASRTLTLPDPGSNETLGYLNIPQNSQSAAYTLVLTDAGKHILHPSADTTARTFTIPANGTVAFPIGTAVTFINQNGAGVVTIAITTDTMRLAGAGTTGSRTLAANGIATAIKITSTEWIISGTGLT